MSSIRKMDFARIYFAVGIIIAVVGTIFALQGDGMIGGSKLMDGNSLFIYIGTLIAVGGLVLAAFGMRPKRPAKAEPDPTKQDLPVV